MVFNTIFNDISVISWQSVLLVEELEVLWENHRPVASHWQTLSHNVASSGPRHEMQHYGSTVNFFSSFDAKICMFILSITFFL